jgi:hexokinase
VSTLPCLYSSSETVFESRVCEVILNGDKTFSLRQQKYRVTEALKTGEATALFGVYAISLILECPY